MPTHNHARYRYRPMSRSCNYDRNCRKPFPGYKDRLRNSIKLDFEVERMEPLFASQEEYDAFAKRQSSYKVKTGDLATYKGNCYLGIDAGSTTTKTALVGEDGTLLYSFYSSNNGNPLKTTIRSIKENIQCRHR